MGIQSRHQPPYRSRGIGITPAQGGEGGIAQFFDAIVLGS